MGTWLRRLCLRGVRPLACPDHAPGVVPPRWLHRASLKNRHEGDAAKGNAVKRPLLAPRHRSTHKDRV